METEGSLACSQQPATDPYPESHASSSHFLTPTPKIHSNSILPPTPWCSERSLRFMFPTKILETFLTASIRATCPTHITYGTESVTNYSEEDRVRGLFLDVIPEFEDRVWRK
jgi:hypothetical protein